MTHIYLYGFDLATNLVLCCRNGVKVDGWGLGWGENWDSSFDEDACNFDAAAVQGEATAATA